MSRKSRLAEQIRRELSSVIQMEMRDPRLGMVTITDVELSRDLSVAKIYYTVFEQDKKTSSQKALESSEGFLRKHLANILSIRSLPRLSFYYDESIERGSRISSMIDKAVADDKLKSHTADESDNQEENQ